MSAVSRLVLEAQTEYWNHDDAAFTAKLTASFFAITTENFAITTYKSVDDVIVMHLIILSSNCPVISLPTLFGLSGFAFSLLWQAGQTNSILSVTDLYLM